MIFGNNLQINDHELQDAVIQNSDGMSNISWLPGKLRFNSNSNVRKLAIGIDGADGSEEGTNYRYLLDGRNGCITNAMINKLTTSSGGWSASDDKIPTNGAVYTFVQEAIGTELSAAMRYMGTVTPTAAAGTIIPGMFVESGTARTSLPTSKGWLYKSTGNGYFGSAKVEKGDSVIMNMNIPSTHGYYLAATSNVPVDSEVYYRLGEGGAIYYTEIIAAISIGDVLYCAPNGETHELYRIVNGEKVKLSGSVVASSETPDFTLLYDVLPQSLFDIIQTNIEGYLPLTAGSDNALTGALYASAGIVMGSHDIELTTGKLLFNKTSQSAGEPLYYYETSEGTYGGLKTDDYFYAGGIFEGGTLLSAKYAPVVIGTANIGAGVVTEEKLASTVLEGLTAAIGNADAKITSIEESVGVLYEDHLSLGGRVGMIEGRFTASGKLTHDYLGDSAVEVNNIALNTITLNCLATGIQKVTIGTTAVTLGTAQTAFEGLTALYFGTSANGAFVKKESSGVLSIGSGSQHTEVDDDLLPGSDNEYDLGSSSLQWGSVYGTTLYEGGTQLSSKYLGINATAANSSKLNGQEASYYATAADYLPLSAGSDKALTGALYASGGVVMGTHNIEFGTGKLYFGKTASFSGEPLYYYETSEGTYGGLKTDDCLHVGGTIYEGGTSLANKYGRIYKNTITGDASTTDFAVTHNLGNQKLIVSIYDATSHEMVLTDVTLTSTSVATIKFAEAPASGKKYDVVIVG